MARLRSVAFALSTAAIVACPTVSSADDLFEVMLIPCNEVLCGVAAETVLREGKVEVCEKGDVEVVVRHGPADAGLCLEFQPWGSDERVLVGDFHTDEEGDAEEKVGVLDVRGEMGIFLVTDCAGNGLLVTGLTTHPDGSGDDEGDDDGEIDDPDDPDDDGVPNDEDPDDDGDGISDDDDANPERPNQFDDVEDTGDLQSTYRTEKRALKSEQSSERRALKDQQRGEKRSLVNDYRARKRELR